MMTDDDCIKLSKEISEMIDEVSDADQALSIMVSVTCNFFLMRFTTEKSANCEYHKFLNVVSSVIGSSEAKDFSSWVSGTAH